MWRRVASTSSAQLQNLAPSASRRSSSLNHTRLFVISSASSPSSTPLAKSAPPSSPHIASASTSALKKTPQEVHPAATGHELEELAAELEGRDVLEINYPVGPFGTKVVVLDKPTVSITSPHQQSSSPQQTQFDFSTSNQSLDNTRTLHQINQNHNPSST